MRVGLMHPGCDFDATAAPPFGAEELVTDLELGSILSAMAGGDEFLLTVARAALLGAASAPSDARDGHAYTSTDVVAHRQEVLHDALREPATFRALYQLATRASGDAHNRSRGLLDDWPAAILNHAVETLAAHAEQLARLHELLTRATPALRSAGMVELARVAREEFDAGYLKALRNHLKQLRPGRSLLASAQLGWGNQGIKYTLREELPEDRGTWLSRQLGRAGDTQTVHLEERDEVGARALAELKDELLRGVAEALADSADHISDFFLRLRTEVGFYVACLNLYDTLANTGIVSCAPGIGTAGTGMPAAEDLVDLGLWLASGQQMAGNSFDGRGLAAIVVTGANQGGKSTFLRSLGQAELMMCAGMDVAARAYTSYPGPALFTHFTRQEDSSMRSGRLDEELARLSGIVEQIRPGSMLLLNESLSSTNEREGSALAEQIVTALTSVGVRVVMVTHLYEFARAYHQTGLALFLRATRNPDGSRSFVLIPGAPEPSAFGDDLYRQVFTEPID